MAKIKAPNKQYNGVSASVGFVNGVGETDNPTLLKWFEDHGYEVVEGKEPQVPEEKDLQVKLKVDGNSKELEEMTVEELTEYAHGNNIEIGKAKSQGGILEKIKEATKVE